MNRFVVAALMMAACAPHAQPAAQSALPAAPDVVVANREGRAIVSARAQVPWQKVLDRLDELKRNGGLRFALAISGEAARASGELVFPRAEQLSNPVSVIDLAEAAHPEDVGGKLVALRAPRTARFGEIVDAVRSLQARGAVVLFAVAPPPAPSTPPKPRLKLEAKCPFPAEADDAKVDDAAVVVDVEVAASGKATSAHALSDPGHGFAGAAEACAVASTYAPARDDAGAPIAARLKLRIHFSR